MVNQTSITPAKRIVVVGAGGNIGSHLVPHLARMPNAGHVTLIDRDVYEAKNLSSQDISPGDVGKRKVGVQARRMRRINHELQAEAIFDAVERVPLGKLKADVILACLDSRIARQHVSQFAWRLGVPLIDSGVEPTSLLARVNVYVPGPESPCLECAWDDRDYEALEQTYPCAGFVSNAAATNAPSGLGALAASLQAIECQKLLSGQFESVAVSKQVLIDAAHHRHYVTAFRRNPNCRFDHEVWRIRSLGFFPSEITLGQLLARFNNGANGATSLSLDGKPFVPRLTCVTCESTRSTWRLGCSLTENQTRCTACGHPMIAAGFDLTERLTAESVPPNVLARPLANLGLRRGDVFGIGKDDRVDHYEVAVDREDARPRELKRVKGRVRHRRPQPRLCAVQSHASKK